MPLKHNTRNYQDGQGQTQHSRTPSSRLCCCMSRVLAVSRTMQRLHCTRIYSTLRCSSCSQIGHVHSSRRCAHSTTTQDMSCVSAASQPASAGDSQLWDPQAAPGSAQQQQQQQQQCSRNEDSQLLAIPDRMGKLWVPRPGSEVWSATFAGNVPPQWLRRSSSSNTNANFSKPRDWSELCLGSDFIQQQFRYIPPRLFPPPFPLASQHSHSSLQQAQRQQPQAEVNRHAYITQLHRQLSPQRLSPSSRRVRFGYVYKQALRARMQQEAQQMRQWAAAAAAAGIAGRSAVVMHDRQPQLAAPVRMLQAGQPRRRRTLLPHQLHQHQHQQQQPPATQQHTPQHAQQVVIPLWSQVQLERQRRCRLRSHGSVAAAAAAAAAAARRRRAAGSHSLSWHQEEDGAGDSADGYSSDAEESSSWHPALQQLPEPPEPPPALMASLAASMAKWKAKLQDELAAAAAAVAVPEAAAGGSGQAAAQGAGLLQQQTQRVRMCVAQTDLHGNIIPLPAGCIGAGCGSNRATRAHALDPQQQQHANSEGSSGSSRSWQSRCTAGICFDFAEQQAHAPQAALDLSAEATAIEPAAAGGGGEQETCMGGRKRRLWTKRWLHPASHAAAAAAAPRDAVAGAEAGHVPKAASATDHFGPEAQLPQVMFARFTMGPSGGAVLSEAGPLPLGAWSWAGPPPPAADADASSSTDSDASSSDDEFEFSFSDDDSFYSSDDEDDEDSSVRQAAALAAHAERHVFRNQHDIIFGFWTRCPYG